MPCGLPLIASTTAPRIPSGGEEEARCRSSRSNLHSKWSSVVLLSQWRLSRALDASSRTKWCVGQNKLISLRRRSSSATCPPRDLNATTLWEKRRGEILFTATYPYFLCSSFSRPPSPTSLAWIRSTRVTCWPPPKPRCAQTTRHDARLNANSTISQKNWSLVMAG